MSWCDVKRDEGKKRFYIISTFNREVMSSYDRRKSLWDEVSTKASGHWLSRRYRKRWLLESFFSSIKHDFDLKEARLRTKDGIKLWIFFSFLAYRLASLERFLQASVGLKQQVLWARRHAMYTDTSCPNTCFMSL